MDNQKGIVESTSRPCRGESRGPQLSHLNHWPLSGKDLSEKQETRKNKRGTECIKPEAPGLTPVNYSHNEAGSQVQKRPDIQHVPAILQVPYRG